MSLQLSFDSLPINLREQFLNAVCNDGYIEAIRALRIFVEAQIYNINTTRAPEEIALEYKRLIDERKFYLEFLEFIDVKLKESNNGIGA